ncbi:MAG: hypothetical protein ING06_10405 [Roseomonas sp.]|jgi:hypothetical protein|nr:hypothetical protein [Roseomonas sp.]
MTPGTGIRIDLDGNKVRLTVVAGDPPEPCAQVWLTPDKARELARMVRNAADFTAAVFGPAQGSA